ncbi:MAG: quinone-dependent dihydroorotate dehydrogenase [Gammaproteobacteria bacterium]
MCYSLIRPLLFCLPPEEAHHWTLKLLKVSHQLRLYQAPSNATSPIEVMGLQFSNRIGLAAGLDKNGDYIKPLADLGFGFIELGTVTPRPQTGNPRPRLFRLPQADAIINRMGFNNKGVDYLVEQVQQAQFKGILGLNIGKNLTTPLDQAQQDYLLGLQRVYPYASYITINISSPNTAGLRQLQFGDELKLLLMTLKQEQLKLAERHQKTVPLVVKIAPDLTAEALMAISDILLEQQMDGVIATNTTLHREGIESLPHAAESGGLSGKPLFAQSLRVVSLLNETLKGAIPIIACGGISSAADVQQMLAAGASLVQIYTGLIYQGRKLIQECIHHDFRNF